jgi:CBS domain containing-hemolysin-like protein
VRVWADRFDVGEIDAHVDTLGGLILAKLGRLPRVGDVVHIRNLTLTVEQMRKRRIEMVMLKRFNNEASTTEQAR